MNVIDEHYAPNFVNYGALSEQSPGPSGIKAAVSAFRATIPDLKVTLADISTEGDRVLTREL